MPINFSLRPYEPGDLDAIIALYHVVRPLGVRPPEADGPPIRWVATDGETVIGYGASSGENPAGLTLLVRPDRRRQGIGSALWQALQSDLVTRSVSEMEAWVRMENTAGVQWLTKQGFRPIKKDGPVRLLLPDVTLAEQSETQGIAIVSLTDEKATDADWLTELHALHVAINGDTPTLETFAAEWNQPEKENAVCYLAKDGAQYVGLSNGGPRDADPHLEEKHDIFQQGFTGVRPEYRQQGIATALKLRVIAHAKAQGFRWLWTNSGNPAMCALNKKMGFQTGPWLIYYRENIMT